VRSLQGHRAAARQALVELEVVGREVVELKIKSGDPDPSYRVRPEIFLSEARALLAEQEGDVAGAGLLLLQAVALEEKLPIDFGPPTIDKPTHDSWENSCSGAVEKKRRTTNSKGCRPHTRTPPHRAGVRATAGSKTTVGLR